MWRTPISRSHVKRVHSPYPWHMIVVHHLNNSRSQRVLWLLEELGLDYEIRHHQRDPQTMLAPPELRAVHPLGKSPVVCDGDAVLAESGAILEYLAETYGAAALLPARADRLRYRYWMHYAEGSLMPPLLLKLVLDRFEQGKTPFPVMAQIDRHLDFVEGELSRTRWFAGDDFTAADIQMSYPLEAAQARAGLDDSRPRLMGFLKRIHGRPAYLRALERGGPYQALS